jgi:hypothetical protein
MSNIQHSRILNVPMKTPYGMSYTECREMVLRGGNVKLSIRQVESFVKDEYILTVVRNSEGMVDKFCFRSFPAQRTIDECYKDTPDETDECTVVIDAKNIRHVIIPDSKSFVLSDRQCLDFVIEFV